jgi:AI-2 transport protein TqsA
MVMPNMEKTTNGKGTGLRVLLTLAALVIIIGGLRAAASLLTPVMLAFFLATLSLPILRVWRKWGVPRFLAVLLTVLVDISILSPIVFVSLGLINEFQNEGMSSITAGTNEAVATFQDFVKTKLHYEVAIDGKEFASEVQKYVRDFIGTVVATLKNLFFVLIITIFFLTEAGGFSKKVASIRKAKGPNFKRFQNTATDIQKYLGIKTVISAITGILAGVLTYSLGLKFFVLWGFVAFIFNYIPAIGSVIASIPPTLLALVNKGAVMEPGIGLALIVLGSYLAINMLLGNFIEPMLLGHRFGVSTSVVILSVLFWGWVWGLVGMFLAVPLTMILKVMLDNSGDFKWLSLAMGNVVEVENEERAVEKKVEFPSAE